MSIGFNVPVWRSKPFSDFSNEELVEYYYKLRTVVSVTQEKDTMTAHYVEDLQDEIIDRMSWGG